MRIDDMILVSIDDHVIEPPDMFERPRARRSTATDAPRSSRTTTASSSWMFQGAASRGRCGLNAVVSWPKEEWGMDPTGFAEMRPGAYDIHERVRDMNRNGIFGVDVLPDVRRLQRRAFPPRPRTKTSRCVMLQAYNDWHIDEWCAAYPGRFIPLAIAADLGSGGAGRRDPAAWPPRAAGRSPCRSCRTCEGLPSYHDIDYWGPFFDALLRRGRRDVPAHRPGLRGHQHGARRPDRQPDHPRHQVSMLARAGPAVGSRVPHVSRPQGGVVRGRHRLDPVLPRPLRPALHEPAVAAATTSATSCRATSSATTRSRAT